MERLAHPVPEAARRVGIGRSKMFQLIAAGEVRSILIGRRRLVPEGELDAYIERRLEAEESA